MSIIVTGASGFIGLNLVKFIKNKKKESVFSVARTYKENISHVVKNYDQVIDLKKTNSILIHLAGQSITNNNLSEQEYNTVKNLSENFKDKMIFISSALVYGNNVKGKANEDYPLCGITDYAINKINSEKEVLKNSGTVLRISNVYGEGMYNKNVFFDIYNQFLDKKYKVKVYNSVAVRDFIHIHDVCKAIIKVSDNPKNGVYNISTGIGTSILELFNFMQIIYADHECKLQSTVQRESNLILDPYNIKCIFDWSYSISIEDGLKNLFANRELG